MKNNVVRLRGRIALFAIATMCSGFARADVTGAQAEALAEHTAMQFGEIVVSTLSACASAYPDTRGNAVSTMEILVPNLKLKPEFADKWIQSIGQCMDKKLVLTRSQCSDIESKVRSNDFSVSDKELTWVLSEAFEMLKPCRRKAD